MYSNIKHIAAAGGLHLKYLDPAVELAPLEANPETPESGKGFGNPEKLVWIEEDIMNIPDGTARIWEALFSSIAFLSFRCNPQKRL